MLDPHEVAMWRLRQKGLAEAHEWTGGWSHSRELLALADSPSYVTYRMIRGLQGVGWDAEAAQNWDRQLEGNKWVPSGLFKQVVKELLPEANTTRKERVRRSFGGVESLPS